MKNKEGELFDGGKCPSSPTQHFPSILRCGTSFRNVPVALWDRIASDCLRNDSSLTDCSLQLCKEVGAHSSKLLPYIEPLILTVQTFFIICYAPFYVV